MSKANTNTSEYIKIRRYVMNILYRTEGVSVQLPSIAELSQLFDVSAPTVCKAMKALTNEGYVIGKRGLGSFTNPNFHTSLSNPLQRKLPIIGIITRDGMAVHYNSYDSQILGELLKRLPFCPGTIHFVSLSSLDPETVYNEIKNEQLDALIWLQPSSSQEETCRRLARESLPLVTCGILWDDVPGVKFDFEEAAYRCGKTLIAEGRKNPVFFPDITPWDLEAQGLRKAYREAGITLNENLFLKDFYTAHEKIKEMISYGTPIDVIYGHMLFENELEDFLYEAAPDCIKSCCIVNPGSSMPNDRELHRINYVFPFEENALALMKVLRNSLNGMNDNSHINLKINLEVK